MHRTVFQANRGALVALVALLGACATTYPRQAPQGMSFPDVTGKDLNGREYRLPRDLFGAPSLLLVGYEQNSQFDIDRWLLGLRQEGIDVRLFEVPTIPGLLPGLFAGKIDQGMRSGIPEEDWVSVITVYGDGERIARFTGNENRLPGRVLLLDGQGRVVFFHDEGYSVGTLLRLKEKLNALQEAE